MKMKIPGVEISEKPSRPGSAAGTGISFVIQPGRRPGRIYRKEQTEPECMV